MIGFTYAKGHSVFCVEGNSWRGRIEGRLECYSHSLRKRCCCLGPWLKQWKELAMAVLKMCIRSWAKNTVRKWDGSCNSRVNFPNIWQLTLNTKIPFQKKCVFMGIIQNWTKHFLIFPPFGNFAQNSQVVILTQNPVLHFCLPSDTFLCQFLEFLQFNYFHSIC